MDKTLSLQIIRLLKISHKPKVVVKRSSLGPDVGNGVFSTLCAAPGVVMCLYPGVYTPGLPLYTVGSAEYLANTTPPSFHTGETTSAKIDENAYIMNLQECGGYIDGCALKSYKRENKLDLNPSACGNLVNHDTTRQNSKVISFSWGDVFKRDVSSLEKNCSRYYPLPNDVRMDGSPWYFDTELDKVVTFYNHSCAENETNEKKVCGAAIVLVEPVSKGDELFLDYGLKEPYPSWAIDWYDR